MNPKYEALINLFKDPEIAQKLMACSAEEAAAFLKEEHSLEFTVEELNEVADGMKAAMAEKSDELSLDQLENVVGGAKSGAYYAGYYVGKVVGVAGVTLGIVGGLVAVGAISW